MVDLNTVFEWQISLDHFINKKYNFQYIERSKFKLFENRTFCPVFEWSDFGSLLYLTFAILFQEAINLPKTRSGKIMRRVLRKIARDEADFGDISTLADPSVVDVLQEGRKMLFAPKQFSRQNSFCAKIVFAPKQFSRQKSFRAKIVETFNLTKSIVEASSLHYILFESFLFILVQRSMLQAVNLSIYLSFVTSQLFQKVPLEMESSHCVGGAIKQQMKEQNTVGSLYIGKYVLKTKTKCFRV